MKHLKNLKKKLVSLESEHFKLYNEIKELDQLFEQIGFPNGLDSLKEISEKIVKEKKLK